MKPLQVDWRDFIKGESSADDLPDRGFSPTSYGLNLTKARGLMYFAESTTDRGGATVVGNIIASTYDKNFLGNDAYHLDDEGNFYTISGGTVTLRQTSTADNYTLGTSDMLQFQGSTYATGQQRVAKLDNSNLTAIDSGWWTGLNSSYRHPLEKVEDKMYLADLNVVYSWDGATSTVACTLPTDVNVTTLRKHPDGRTLLAFCGLTANFSHQNGMGGRVYFIDTNTKQWTREIELDVQVEGSKNVGGIIYVTYGQNVGYFNGTGISFLKRLTTSTTTYSHNLGDWEGILLVRDGLTVLAYGDLGVGRVWWRPYRNDVNSNNINNIIYKGADKLLVAFSDGAGGGKLVELNLANGGLGGQFVGNRTTFPITTEIRRVEFGHTPGTGVTYRFNVYEKDEVDGQNLIYDSNPTSATSNWSKYRNELDLKRDWFQFLIIPSNGAPGFRYFRFMYEGIEQ